MAGEPRPHTDFSKRRALKIMALAAAGGGLLILISTIGLGSNPVTNTTSQSETASSFTSSSASDTALNDGSSVRIKVRYFQMSSTLPGISQEYFVLQAPAHYPDLLRVVTFSHPVIAEMMPTMLVLAEGVVAKSDTLLRSGDEVDFIPTVSGG